MPHPSPGESAPRPHPAPATQSRAASADLLHLDPQTFVEFVRATRVKIVNLLKLAEFGRLAFRPPQRGGPGWGRGGGWLRGLAGVEPPPQPLPAGEGLRMPPSSDRGGTVAPAQFHL